MDMCYVLCFLGCLSMLYLDISLLGHVDMCYVSLLSVWTCGHVLCFWV